VDPSTHTRRHTLRRILSDELLMPVFEPMKDEVVIEQWIRHVDELAERYGWDDLIVMWLIATRLRGHARQWYDTRQRITTTWSQTKVLLVAQFRKTVPFSRLFKETASYEARPGQNLRNYCFQKLFKLRKLDIYIPDKYQVDMVIGGIPDDAVVRTVRLAQYDDSNALYAFMNTLGDMPSQGRVAWDRSVPPTTSGGSRPRPTAIDGDCWKAAKRPAMTEKGGKEHLLKTQKKSAAAGYRADAARSGDTTGEGRSLMCPCLYKTGAAHLGA
jgi:hypothetical protein